MDWASIHFLSIGKYYTDGNVNNGKVSENIEVIGIYFTSEYESKLLKSEKINHLAWILTNAPVLRMFNSIGKSIWQSGELKYYFLLNRFNIRARVKRNNSNSITVLEIISLYRKRINVDGINIFHPSLKETQSSNEAKIRKYVNKKFSCDRELTFDGDGSTKDSEEIETSLIAHEYERLPKIYKRKTGTKISRKNQDENTKEYFLDKNKLRSTADVGGENLIRGLEFTTLDKIEEKGELEEFIEILKLLEKRPNIKSANIIIGYLPEGIKVKKFSRLRDGIARRKYAIGRIVMMNGEECSLIEIE